MSQTQTQPREKETKAAKGTFVMEVKAIGDPDDPNGEFEAVLSTPQIDRDGEILDAHCFDPLPAEIPILEDHVNATKALVATAYPYYDDRGILRAKGKFSRRPNAQLIRQDLKDKMHLGMSVGFGGAPRVYDANGIPHMQKGELYESSFIPLQANTDAFAISVKAWAEAPEGSFEDIQERVKDALQESYGSDSSYAESAYVWLVATYTDHVIYTIGEESFDVSYVLDDAADSVVFGTPVAVEVETVISPKSLARVASKKIEGEDGDKDKSIEDEEAKKLNVKQKLDAEQLQRDYEILTEEINMSSI